MQAVRLCTCQKSPHTTTQVALPAVDEEDIQWMREHRIKAFRAVTTGNYGDKGRVGAGQIGRGVGKRKGKISN